MKNYYLLFLCFLSLAVSAQQFNRVETACDGSQERIHQILGTGKALIVISNGLDCGICRSKAGAWASWAGNHQNQVRVWGAHTYTYNNNVPSCQAVQNWDNNYNWSVLHTFIDSNEYYFEAGTPRYLVYNPADSTIADTLFNESQARSLALTLSQVPLGQQKQPLDNLQFRLHDNQLHLWKLPARPLKLQLINLSGQISKQVNINDQSYQMDVSDLPSGIYLIKISDGSSIITRKLVKA